LYILEIKVMRTIKQMYIRPEVNCVNMDAQELLSGSGTNYSLGEGPINKDDSYQSGGEYNAGEEDW
jgi:hypothetical protein